MKRFLLFSITGLILLWNASSYAAGELGEFGGANENPHNLSSLSTTSGGDLDVKTADTTEICIFCHTPHSARSVAPLWGRPDSTVTFGIRAGLQISNAAIVNTTLYGTAPDYPNGATKVCLSCHDGVTAMGVLANGDEFVMTTSTLSGEPSQIDLTISHPVSFVYNSAVQTFLGGTYILPPTDYLDSASRVQCTTCHQPHKDTFDSNSLPFWRLDTGFTNNDYDNVCLGCHTAVLNSKSAEHNY